MKSILITILFTAVISGRKASISPVLWTNAQIPVTNISVEVVNKTEGSVDFYWRLYNDTDSLIDYGIIQLGAINIDSTGARVFDRDFINFNNSPDSFPLPYVCGIKGLTIIKY